MSVAYAFLAVLALLLFIAYGILVRRKNPWLLTLYASVILVCLGYFLLSLSKTTEFALLANKIAYLGSVCLPLCMLLTILDLCCISYGKWIPVALGALLPAAVVLGNLGVWLVEQLIRTDFEFLAVSYLFSEVILLGLYWLMQDYVRYDCIPTPAAQADAPPSMEEREARILAVLPVGVTLHPRERQVLEAILDNKRRKDIAAELFLSENTVKTYTRNLYNKLGEASREELYALPVP